MARRRVVGQSGHRRLTQWVGPAIQGYVSVASAGATLIASVPLDEAATIVRTRGQVSVKPFTFAADLNVVGAIGLGIVSSEALAVGVTAVPEPFADGDWGGWFVWRSFSFHYEFGTAVGQSIESMDFEIDSKAMRKGGPNESVVIVAESQGGAFDISMPLRMLIKLS